MSQLVARFHGRPVGNSASVGASLADLFQGSGIRWFVSTDDDLPIKLETLVADVESVEERFLRPVSTLTGIVDQLSATAADQPGLGHLAVAAALAGRADIAASAIGQYAERQPARPA